jgi:hypothetical protein
MTENKTPTKDNIRSNSFLLVFIMGLLGVIEMIKGNSIASALFFIASILPKLSIDIQELKAKIKKE